MRISMEVWSPFLGGHLKDYEDNVMKKIKNWRFNPPPDEEEEWPTNTKFNPLLRWSTVFLKIKHGLRAPRPKLFRRRKIVGGLVGRFEQ